VTAKYFIAVLPSEPVYSEIESIKKTVSEKYNNKSTLRSPPHITLHMPFEWKSEKESVLVSSLERFKFDSEFEIELKNFGCFEPKVVFIDVVPCELLNRLRHLLTQHIKLNLNIFNEANSSRAFHPHLTIAFRDLKKTAFYEMMGEYRDKTYSATIKTQSFFLLKHTGKVWLPFKEFKFTI
jgi:2'-5' RNA ligase